MKRRYRLPVGWISLFNLHVMEMKSPNSYRYLLWLSKKALQLTILGFNAIKELVNKNNNTSALINSHTNNLMNTNRSNVSTLNKLISTSEKEDIIVSTMSNSTIVPVGKLVSIPWKVNFSSTTKSIPMLFETGEIELLKCLEIVNTIITVKSGLNHRLRIPVLDNSKHNIILQKNTNIDRIHQISSVAPWQVQ